jgi:hypothetical protein
MILIGLRIEQFSDRAAKTDQTGGDIKQALAGLRESLREMVNNL